MRKDISNGEEYFEWLLSLIYNGLYPSSISYTKLLSYLYCTDFTYVIDRDRNRASDGAELRYRYIEDDPMADCSPDFLEQPCSVLEMMVGLALRCEETIMDDPSYGNRIRTWFWGMINNLGLGGQYDSDYDSKYVQEVIERFLNRDYAPNGKGGLFTIRHRDQDMRDVEIWYQLQYYLDEIV